MGGFGMADKKQFDGSETSKKSKSLLFSLSQAKPASTAEAETLFQSVYSKL